MEVRAAGHQNIAVTGDLIAIRAKDNICEDLLLPKIVQLQEEVGQQFFVFIV